MEIFKTSYYNKEIERKINNLAGKSYSFLDRIKMKGIGSRRLEVFKASEEIQLALNAEYYITLVSLEIRPKALMVYFRKKIDNYTCVFPYSALEIEEQEKTKLVCGDHFIVLANDPDFFEKLRKFS